ncbi:hypothetical protein SAMN05216189_102451 [Pseudomonas delhiensis]|uniref:Uncharacterized protein n=1 Tax=Pseudomonas delhiensis TaxID=366289 RepID=A0A239M872_9PSED|nr:hypothetical protein [Pseudomonas delhiensis]SDJ86675.1 hypothetical protein SAMN05216189_102451 [Pseudomonas delhiensis]SNT38244.1 hypothetical protein SAMN06295949_12451 [Pseudomonas delhiensis]
MTTVAILYRETDIEEISELLRKHQLLMLPAVMRSEGRRLAATLDGERDENGNGVLLLEIPVQTREYGEDFVAVFFHSSRYDYRSQGQLQATMQRAQDAWEDAGGPNEFFVET